MIDPSLYELAFPHGLGLLVILKQPMRCPKCGRAQKLWASLPASSGHDDSCLGCATLPEPKPEARL